MSLGVVYTIERVGRVANFELRSQCAAVFGPETWHMVRVDVERKRFLVYLQCDAGGRITVYNLSSDDNIEVLANERISCGWVGVLPLFSMNLNVGDRFSFGDSIYIVRLASGGAPPNIRFEPASFDVDAVAAAMGSTVGLAYQDVDAALRDFPELYHAADALRTRLLRLGAASASRDELLLEPHSCNRCGVRITVGAFGLPYSLMPNLVCDPNSTLCLDCGEHKRGYKFVLTRSGVVVLDALPTLMNVPPIPNIPPGDASQPPLVLNSSLESLRRCLLTRVPGTLQSDPALISHVLSPVLLSALLPADKMLNVRVFDEGFELSSESIRWDALMRLLDGEQLPARWLGVQLSDFPSADAFPDIPEHMLTLEYALPDLWTAWRAVCPYADVILGDRNCYNHLPRDLLPSHPTKTYLAAGRAYTYLHLDAHAAINVLLWGEPAVWTLFSAADTQRIQEYVRLKFKQDGGYDSGVLLNNCFLMSDHLADLVGIGIHHWRIVQKPGMGVVVPVGCVHQVRSSAHGAVNPTDCDVVQVENQGANFKLAMDFMPAYTLRQVMEFDQLRRNMLLSHDRRRVYDQSRYDDISQTNNCVVFAALAAFQRMPSARS